MADINYEENRFGYLKEYTKEELQKEKDEIESDLAYLSSQVESGKIKRDQLVEFRNDIMFLHQKLNYIEKNISLSETKSSKKAI